MTEVSVICLTYNHAKFIKEALDSILNQSCDFDYEVLVADDASTDGTADILREYIKLWESKSPGRLKVLFRENNTGASNNEYELLMSAKGRYIASCELDDIWTDMNKLQIQYDFMESHPEYMGVAHNFHIIDKNSKIIEAEDNQRIKDYLDKPFTLQDFLEKGFVFQTATHFYRNFYKDGGDYSIIYKADRLIRDKTVLSLVLFRGDYYILPQDMSAYRRFFDTDATNGRAITNANMPLDLYTKARHVERLNEYFRGEIDYSLSWADIIMSYLKGIFKEDDPYKISEFIYMYRHADNRTKSRIKGEIAGSIKRYTFE